MPAGGGRAAARGPCHSSPAAFIGAGRLDHRRLGRARPIWEVVNRLSGRPTSGPSTRNQERVGRLTRGRGGTLVGLPAGLSSQPLQAKSLHTQAHRPQRGFDSHARIASQPRPSNNADDRIVANPQPDTDRPACFATVEGVQDLLVLRLAFLSWPPCPAPDHHSPADRERWYCGSR